MATKRLKSWFFQGVSTELGFKFRTNNKPTQATFEDLLESSVFSLESSDTATESSAGHVKVATKAEVVAKTDTVNGFQKVVKPSDLPDIGTTVESGSTILGFWQSEGINITKHSQPTENALKYIVSVLINTTYLKFNDCHQITLSDDFVTLINDLSGIVPTPGDGLVIGLSSIDSNGFVGGGIINTAGVFTVDVDDNTMEIDSTTKKVQLKDKGTTLAKLQDLVAGEIIVGPDGNGVPIVLSLLGENNILQGTATGVEIVNLNDLIAAISIADNSILARKIDISTLGDGLTKDTSLDDSSRIYVSLSDAASLEFSDHKLQLENDSLTPSAYSFYGTDYNGDKGYNNLFTTGVPLMKTISKVLASGPQEQTFSIQTDVLEDTNLALELMNFQLKVYVHTALDSYLEVTDHTVNIFTDSITGYVDSLGISLTGTGLTATSSYTYYFVFTYKPTPIA